MSDPADNLECYLVGGAVRDELLGLPPGDRDWVVVGATPPQMGDLGFTPVGVDFPVFLHPHSHEEYALARTERKSAPGYRGFTIHADQDVTLEQDLARRDLTINAIARRADGTLIDPFDGQADIASRTLRHVSPAFTEDPVRLLRVARFATRFNAQNFCVADETLTLMADLVRNGEVNALVAERVWAETRRALDDARPSVFFNVLRSCGALAVLFPEIDALFGVPQRARYHPEIDTGVHVMMALDMAAQLGASNRTRFAVLLHDLGKALTPEDVLPAHIGHEGRGVKPVRAMSARLKVPSDYRDLAVLVCENHLKMHQLMQLRPSTINKLLNSLGAFRQNSNVDDFALACECDARGRKGLEQQNYPQRGQLQHFAQAASEISAAAIQSERVSRGHEPLQGPAIGAAMEKERCRAIERVKNEFSNQSQTTA